jgi:hypothetical protein
MANRWGTRQSVPKIDQHFESNRAYYEKLADEREVLLARTTMGKRRRDLVMGKIYADCN